MTEQRKVRASMKSKVFLSSALVLYVFIFVTSIDFQSVSATAISDGLRFAYPPSSRDQVNQLAPTAVIMVGGTITSNTTWTTDNIYVVQTDITVGTGVTLTIEPGTIVKFQDSRSMIVNGMIQALGTVGQKIYFTSWHDDSVGGDTNGNGGNSAPSPGNWKYIRFDDASDDASLIDYAVIRYGGGWSAAGGVEIHDASPTIRNCQISQHYTDGIYLDTTVSSLPSRPQIFTNTLSSNSSYAVSSNVDSRPQLRGNSLTGNGGNGLEIRGGSIQNDLTWDQTQVVYILSGDVSIASSAQLTMAPGLILKFRDNCGLLVGGNLHAVGTVGQKIYFTSWRDDSAGGIPTAMAATPRPVPAIGSPFASTMPVTTPR